MQLDSILTNVFLNLRLNGSSSTSETYGNPCLANTEEFEVKEVEVIVEHHSLLTWKIHMWYLSNLLLILKSAVYIVYVMQLWGFVYTSKYEEMLALSRTEAPGICRW